MLSFVTKYHRARRISAHLPTRTDAVRRLVPWAMYAPIIHLDEQQRSPTSTDLYQWSRHHQFTWPPWAILIWILSNSEIPQGSVIPPGWSYPWTFSASLRSSPKSGWLKYITGTITLRVSSPDRPTYTARCPFGTSFWIGFSWPTRTYRWPVERKLHSLLAPQEMYLPSLKILEPERAMRWRERSRFLRSRAIHLKTFTSFLLIMIPLFLMFIICLSQNKAPPFGVWLDLASFYYWWKKSEDWLMEIKVSLRRWTTKPGWRFRELDDQRIGSAGLDGSRVGEAIRGKWRDSYAETWKFQRGKSREWREPRGRVRERIVN